MQLSHSVSVLVQVQLIVIAYAVVSVGIGRVDRFNQPNALAEHDIKKACLNGGVIYLQPVPGGYL